VNRTRLPGQSWSFSRRSGLYRCSLCLGRTLDRYKHNQIHHTAKPQPTPTKPQPTSTKEPRNG